MPGCGGGDGRHVLGSVCMQGLFVFSLTRDCLLETCIVYTHIKKQPTSVSTGDISVTSPSYTSLTSLILNPVCSTGVCKRGVYKGVYKGVYVVYRKSDPVCMSCVYTPHMMHFSSCTLAICIHPTPPKTLPMALRKFSINTSVFFTSEE